MNSNSVEHRASAVSNSFLFFFVFSRRDRFDSEFFDDEGLRGTRRRKKKGESERRGK